METKSDNVARNILFLLHKQNQTVAMLANFIRDNDMCPAVVQMVENKISIDELKALDAQLQLPLSVVYENGVKSSYFIQEEKPLKIEVTEDIYIPLDLPQNEMSFAEAEAYCKSIKAHILNRHECHPILNDKREAINQILARFGKPVLSYVRSYWVNEYDIHTFSAQSQGDVHMPQACHLLPVYCF